MNAPIPNQATKFLAADAHVDALAVQPLPNSRKIYVQGSQPDIRVPMREISQADTPLMFSGESGSGGARSEPNPPIFVYDCSGPGRGVESRGQALVGARSQAASLSAPGPSRRAALSSGPREHHRHALCLAERHE